MRIEKSPTHARQGGFSLIELIVTLVLIATAVALIGVAIYNYTNESKANTTITEMQALDAAVVAWETGRSPTTYGAVTCDMLTQEAKVPFATQTDTTCPLNNWGGTFAVADGNPSTTPEITVTASGITNTKACADLQDMLQNTKDIDPATSGCTGGTATAGFFR